MTALKFRWITIPSTATPPKRTSLQNWRLQPKFFMREQLRKRTPTQQKLQNKQHGLSQLDAEGVIDLSSPYRGTAERSSATKKPHKNGEIRREKLGGFQLFIGICLKFNLFEGIYASGFCSALNDSSRFNSFWSFLFVPSQGRSRCPLLPSTRRVYQPRLRVLRQGRPSAWHCEAWKVGAQLQ